MDNGLEGRQYAAGSVLVQVHDFHSGSWLDVESSCVETDSLADKGDPLVTVGVSVVAQIDEGRCVNASSTNGVEESETLVQELFSFDDGQLGAVLLADSLGLLDEVLRGSFNIASSIGPLLSSDFGQGMVQNLVDIFGLAVNCH